MAEKHYHNDYKKILGVDESRTASQKLLDKFGRKNATVRDKAQDQENQRVGRKLVKREQGTIQISEQQMLVKIKKIVDTKESSKMIKGVSILLKCLENGQFKSPQTNDKHVSIEDVCEYCKQISLQGVKGSMVQQISLAEKLAAILKLLCHNQRVPESRSEGQNENRQPINHSSSQQIPLKQQKEGVDNQKEQLNQDNNILQNKQSEPLPCKKAMEEQLNLKIDLLSLYTDDNFSFQKSLAAINNKIITVFDERQSTQLKQDDKAHKIQLSEFVIKQILGPMFALPQLALLEWAQTAILNFFKQFIKVYRHVISQHQDERIILAKYNELLEQSKKKKNSTYGSGNSLNIDKKQNTSWGAYNIIEKVDSEARWFSKQ